MVVPVSPDSLDQTVRVEPPASLVDPVILVTLAYLDFQDSKELLDIPDSLVSPAFPVILVSLVFLVITQDLPVSLVFLVTLVDPVILVSPVNQVILEQELPASLASPVSLE